MRALSRMRSISGQSAIVASSSSATAGSSHLVQIDDQAPAGQAAGIGRLADARGGGGDQLLAGPARRADGRAAG